MEATRALISNTFDIWIGAVEARSTAGRTRGRNYRLYGIDKLRSLILAMAVRGNLVPQIESEEPARQLLERISRARSNNVVYGRSRRSPRDEIHKSGLGPVPAGWATAPLGQIAVVQAGFAFKSSGFNEDGVGLPLIRIRDVGQPFSGTFYSGEFRDEFIVEKGEYLISMDGEFRVAVWVGSRALLNQRVSRLTFLSPEIVPQFVAMALQEQLSKLQGTKAYTTVDHLSGKQIADACLLLPPAAEQGRIVAKVDELMAICDRLEAESYEAIDSHGLLISTLLDALVASGTAEQLAECWSRIEHNFDELTTEVGVDRLKQTIIDLAVSGGFSPAADWKNNPIKLKHVAQLQNGYAFKSEWFSSAGIRLLRNINVSHGSIDWSEEVRLPEERAGEFARFELREGDIVLTLDRPFISTGTKVAIVTEHDLPALLLQRIGRFQLSERITADFLYIWIESSFFRRQIDPGRSNGVPHISTKQVEASNICVPPICEQARIVSLVRKFLEKCSLLKRELSHAAAIERKLADVVLSNSL